MGHNETKFHFGKGRSDWKGKYKQNEEALQRAQESPQQTLMEQAGWRSEDHAYTGSRVARGSCKALTKSLSQLAGCFPLAPMRAIFFVSSLHVPRLS